MIESDLEDHVQMIRDESLVPTLPWCWKVAELSHAQCAFEL